MRVAVAFEENNKMQFKPDREKPWKTSWSFYATTSSLAFHCSLKVQGCNLVGKPSHISLR